MTGEVIPFPDRSKPPASLPALAAASLPEPFTPAWQAEHLPLVGQAMDLLAADDAELRRRCQAMAGRNGRSLVAELAAQVDDIGARIGETAIALALAALRIRHVMTTLPA